MNMSDIAKNAATFADEFLEPVAADLDRAGIFPRAVISELVKRGLLGLTVSATSGAAGAGFTALVETVQALANSCAAVAEIVINHEIASYAIAKWGSPAQRDALLPPMAKGERLGALGIYEHGPAPGTGPDALLVRPAEGGYLLNGTKAFVRNAGVASVYVVVATPEPDSGIAGPVLFIIETATSGISIGPAYETMGLRGCPVADLVCKNVALSPAAILGSGADSSIAAELCAAYALAEAAQTVGIGKAAAKHAAAAARHRVQFGHPIASLQAIQTLLADIVTDVHLAWLGVLDGAQRIDNGVEFAPQSAMIKLFLERFASKMLIDAIQVQGGIGICETLPKHFKGTLPLARMFRDIAGTTFMEPDLVLRAQLITDSI